jgi:hypothetical protein
MPRLLAPFGSNRQDGLDVCGGHKSVSRRTAHHDVHSAVDEPVAWAIGKTLDGIAHVEKATFAAVGDVK